MTSFKMLTFSHGLNYASTASTYPEHVNLWHFILLLDNLPKGWLTPLGLSPHQLSQMLMNYRSCLAQIFANGHNYHSIPPIHKSPVTWCSTFYSALVHAMQLIMVPEVIAAWEAHCRNNPGQGLHLTTSFIHHLGLLHHLFDDWLDVAKQDMQYCQAFITFDRYRCARMAIQNRTDSCGEYIGPNNLQREVLLLGHQSSEDVQPTINS